MALGELGLGERPVRVHRPVRLEVAAEPGEELRAALFLRHLDRVVEAGDADTALGEGVDLGQVVALQHRVTVAAISEEEDRVGVVEGGRVGRPAAGVRLGDELREWLPGEVVVEALLGEQGAGTMLVLAGGVARPAGHEHQLLAAVGELQPLEPDVLELHLHRRADVQLQGKNALHGPLVGLLVERLRHQLAVDEVLELRTSGHDPVLVPVALLDHLLKFGRVADRLAGHLRAIGRDRDALTPLAEDAAAFLLVDDSRIGRARLEVGLVAADHEVTQILAAVLDAAVGLGGACDPVGEREFEVVDQPLPPDQEGVVLGQVLGGGLTDNDAVLDPPELRLSLPARQRRAIEERHARLVGADESA